MKLAITSREAPPKRFHLPEPSTSLRQFAVPRIGQLSSDELCLTDGPWLPGKAIGKDPVKATYICPPESTDHWKAAKEGFVIGAIGPPLLAVPCGLLLGLSAPASSIAQRLAQGLLGAVGFPLAVAPVMAPLMAVSAMIQAPIPVIEGEILRDRDGDLQFVSSELHCPISLKTMQPDLSGVADKGDVPSGSYLLKMQSNQQLAVDEDNPHDMSLALKFDSASQRVQQTAERLRQQDESPQDLATHQRGKVEIELADGSHELLMDQWTVTGRQPKRLESGDLSLESDARGNHLRWADGDQFFVAHTNRAKTETQIHVLSKQRWDELQQLE